MMSKFQEGDLVVGKAKTIYGFVGMVKSVTKDGKHWNFQVKWDNGRETMCGLRSLEEPGVPLPSNPGRKRKRNDVPQGSVEDDSQDTSEDSSSNELSTSSSSNESLLSGDENDERRYNKNKISF